MRKIIHWGGRAGAAVGVAVLLAGCGLSSVGGPAGGPATGPPVTITQNVAPSALVTVLSGPASGPPLSGLVAGTARPREDITILQAGTPPKTIVAADSPAPPKVVISGQPAAPGSSATSYQSALYAKRLKHWRDKLAAGKRVDARQTHDAVSAWVRQLKIQAKVGELNDPPGDLGDLAAESAAAADALTGLEEEAGDVFGGRRVIVLYCSNLGGMPPAGELAGNAVIVLTPFLPTVAAASAAQAALLAAGAAQATVLGPEVTGTQLAELVSADLSQKALTEVISEPVLFANDSAALLPTAARGLTRLLPELRKRGAMAVINGYASAPGTTGINFTLSYERAAAVASFLESRGIPDSALIIVGHGASNLVAAGTSGRNRRVTVVIEES